MSRNQPERHLSVGWKLYKQAVHQSKPSAKKERLARQKCAGGQRLPEAKLKQGALAIENRMFLCKEDRASGQVTEFRLVLGQQPVSILTFSGLHCCRQVF